MANSYISKEIQYYRVVFPGKAALWPKRNAARGYPQDAIRKALTCAKLKDRKELFIPKEHNKEGYFMPWIILLWPTLSK